MFVALMVHGLVALVTGRPFHVAMNSWPGDTTCLDRAVNAANSNSSLLQGLLTVKSNLSAAPMELGLVNLKMARPMVARPLTPL